MFGAECCQRRCVKNWPEQNQLVESPRLLPIAAKKNHRQPDRQNHAAGNVRPDHLAGNRDENHDHRRIHQTAAHSDSLQPAASRAAPPGGYPAAAAAAACAFSSGFTLTALASSTTCFKCHHSRSPINLPSLLAK